MPRVTVQERPAPGTNISVTSVEGQEKAYFMHLILIPGNSSLVPGTLILPVTSYEGRVISKPEVYLYSFILNHI
jgi:hypothetical protein